jgi:hypothetical protein
MKRIIFENDNGGVAIIVPSPEAVDLYGIEAIAQKDVPEGKTFYIVDEADIPDDRTDRDTWTVDMILARQGAA